jgi:hypothetical protein
MVRSEGFGTKWSWPFPEYPEEKDEKLRMTGL